jgi:hypothetical protein
MPVFQQMDNFFFRLTYIRLNDMYRKAGLQTSSFQKTAERKAVIDAITLILLILARILLHTI